MKSRRYQEEIRRQFVFKPIGRNKANWIGEIKRRSCAQKLIIEGKPEVKVVENEKIKH